APGSIRRSGAAGLCREAQRRRFGRTVSDHAGRICGAPARRSCEVRQAHPGHRRQGELGAPRRRPTCMMVREYNLRRQPMRKACGALALVAALLCGQPASAQSPSPEARAAARDLIATMKLTDQFKVLMPMIFEQFKPVIVQGRPEVERDYNAT